MGCCEDCLTCDIVFNAIMPLSRASTRGSYSRIEGVTIIAVLRRSPASVEHHHRHHTVVLTELSLGTQLDRSSRDVIELNLCKNSEVSYVRYLIGRIVKTYDYINRVVLTLPLSVYEGTWTTLSPLVAMHHHDLACA